MSFRHRITELGRLVAVPLTLTVFMGGLVGGLALARTETSGDVSRPAATAPPSRAVVAAVHIPIPAPARRQALAQDAWPARLAAPALDRTPPAPFVPKRVAQEVRVGRGDTLIDLLQRSGLEYPEAIAAVASLNDVFDPRGLRVGQTLVLETEPTQGGAQRLMSLNLNLDFTRDLELERGTNGAFAAAEVPRALRTEVEVASASVTDSLYNAARAQDVPDAALLKIIKLFSYDIDFQRDIQPGDGIDVVYERVSTADGRERRTGNLLHAAIRSGGGVFTAYRFKDANGNIAYFDANGKSLKKWLMRTPINGARLSSGFGKRRHPILGYTKMHKGTDFAAPSGTPIYAAGDGVVDMIGRRGGYGNYVRLRHSSEFSTAYAHMKGFKKGLKRGARVRQGQVIGYVGTTGRSTGPHLHYEVLKSGVQINPMSLKPQTLARLTGDDLRRFKAEVARIEALKDRRVPKQYAQVP